MELKIFLQTLDRKLIGTNNYYGVSGALSEVRRLYNHAMIVTLNEYGLELHPDKTKIVYCKDKDRNKEYPVTEFDFLGYTFKGIWMKDRLGRIQQNFLPMVSKKAAKAFRDKIRAMELHKKSCSKIEMIAEQINPIVRGWLNYFMSYCKSAVSYTMHCLNERLCRWARHKFKRFRGHKIKAKTWLQELAKREPNMFAHWALGWKP